MDAALRWLDGRKNRPFFAWIHLYDPSWTLNVAVESQRAAVPVMSARRSSRKNASVRPSGEIAALGTFLTTTWGVPPALRQRTAEFDPDRYRRAREELSVRLRDEAVDPRRGRFLPCLRGRAA